MGSKTAAFTLVAIIGLGAASCTAEAGDRASSDATADGGAGLDVSAQPALDPETVRQSERALIHTAERHIDVDDVEDARSAAIDIADGAGGFVDHEDAELDGSPRVTLVLKVPPAEYRAVLEAIEALGTVTQRAESTEDVTAQVVDIDARISSTSASVDRLRQLLEGRGSLDEIVKLERELTTRISELESLTAVQRDLAEQIDHATITVTLRKPAKTASSGEPSEKIPGFLRGLKTGWGAFVNVVLGIVTVAGFALPFLVASGIVVVIVRPIWRRVRRRRPRGELFPDTEGDSRDDFAHQA